MMDETVIKVLRSLEEAGAGAWNALVAACPDATCFQSHEWITSWWKTFRSGKELRLYAAYRNGQLVGLAPMYLESSTLRFVGEGHSDYNIFLWHADERPVVAQLLDVMLDNNDIGIIEFAEIPASSTLAQELSCRQTFRLVRNAATPCPRLVSTPQTISNALRKKSVKRSRNKLNRLGTVTVRHLQQAADIEPHLNTFYSHHISRWSATAYPSLFLKDSNRAFYEALIYSGLPVVFTAILLDDRLVASHFGMLSAGYLIWYKPAFDIRLATCSPGEALLAALLEYVSDHGLAGLDFTRGNEAFKLRFCSEVRYNENLMHYRSIPYGLIGRKLLKKALGRVLPVKRR